MPLSDFACHLDDADIQPAPLQHPEQLAGSIEAPRRRRITAGRLFGIAVQMAAGLVALVAVIALVA